MRKYFEFVRFSHTVFALPFALAAMLVAGWPGWKIIVLILMAMVCARTAAMGFNRIIDQRYDAQNPRTAQRHLPARKIGIREAWTLVAGGAGGGFFGAWFFHFSLLLSRPRGRGGSRRFFLLARGF